jgi:hypothetical protein
MHKIWRKYNGVLVPNTPPEASVDTSNIIKDIIYSNSLLARWVTDFDCKKEMPFWYIIKDNSSLIENYSSNTRNQIKKGLKNFEIRKVNKYEIHQTAYSIYKKAFKAYEKNKTIVSLEVFQKNLKAEFDYWGVYRNDKLVGYAHNRVYDESCDYSTIKIDPKHKNEYPFYALIYKMNEYYLEESSLSYVTDGARSISHQTNIQDFLVKKFKFRKAYCHLHLRYHPVISIFVRILYPFRSLFENAGLRIFKNISIILSQEELKRESDKIAGITHKNDAILVISNGNFKSGSTWVTAIVKELIKNKNVLFPDNFQEPIHRNWLNRYKIGSFINSEKFNKEQTWISKAHIYQKDLIYEILQNQDNIKLINIDRDVKDVIVSHYHHLKSLEKINLDFKSYFDSWGKYKAIQCLQYSKAWKDVDFCLKLKYEDLKNSTPESIKKIANYLGVNVFDILKVQEETRIKNLRSNSVQKGLNEDEWFYRKGVVGDWKNYFDDEMLNKISCLEKGQLNLNENVNYFIKFTFRLRIKYFLYRYFPGWYVIFDKRF